MSSAKHSLVQCARIRIMKRLFYFQAQESCAIEGHGGTTQDKGDSGPDREELVRGGRTL